MTDVLEQAIAIVRALPVETQGDLAHMLLAYGGDEREPVHLTPDEGAAIAEGEAEADRGYLGHGGGDAGCLSQVRRVKLRFTSRAAQRIDEVLAA